MPRKTNKIEHTVSRSNAPTPAPTYEKPSFASTILQGFALGTGQSLAFNMFRSDPVKEKPAKEEPVKETNYKEFIQCVKDNSYEDCKHYLNL